MDTGWERNPGIKKIREFGLLVGGVLLVIGAVMYWRHPEGRWAVRLAGTGATLIVFGLLAPRLLKPVYQIWMALAYQLGRLMTNVLLTIFYIVGFGLVSIVLRVVRKDPLSRQWSPGKNATYWRPRDILPLKDRDLKPY